LAPGRLSGVVGTVTPDVKRGQNVIEMETRQ